MAVCPLIGWQKTSLPTLLRMAIVPGVAGIIAGAVGAMAFGVTEAKPLLTVVLIFFALTALVAEFWRGAAARRKGSGEALPLAMLSAVNRNRRRYGGYVVHIGIMVIYLGILGSSNYKTEADHQVAPDQSFQVGRFTILYKGILIERLPDFLTLKGVVEITEGDKRIGVMTPERRYYFHWEQPSAEVAVYPSLRDDLYLTLVSPSIDQGNLQRVTPGFFTDVNAAFKVTINPLINWIWFGGVLTTIGGAWALWPRKRREEQ
jgi:cytochrome c-type biogenesis protein CcmF